MDETLFTATVRDRAIETTCSNLVMCGELLPDEVGDYMARLTGLSNLDLARQLLVSRMDYDHYLENQWSKN